MTYEIWIEGFRATGESLPARFLGEWEGETFEHACVAMMTEEEWDMGCTYNAENNSFWERRFYDNEVDARKTYG